MFGWLDNFDLSYKLKGTIIRAIRAGIAASIGVFVAALSAGTLLEPETAPFVVVIVTVVIQALDKFIRELNIEREAKDLTTDNPEG